MNLIKVFIASIRWGELSPSDVELVKSSTLKQVLRASYVRKSIFSPSTIVVLDSK
jgi:hypothetical protein